MKKIFELIYTRISFDPKKCQILQASHFQYFATKEEAVNHCFKLNRLALLQSGLQGKENEIHYFYAPLEVLAKEVSNDYIILDKPLMLGEVSIKF